MGGPSLSELPAGTGGCEAMGPRRRPGWWVGAAVALWIGGGAAAGEEKAPPPARTPGTVLESATSARGTPPNAGSPRGKAPGGQNGADTPPGSGPGDDGLPTGDESAEPDAAKEVFVRVMPTRSTVYLRDNTKAYGHVLARTEKGLTLIEQVGDPDPAKAEHRERWIPARDIRSVVDATPAGVRSASAPGGTTPGAAGAQARWPGFVARHPEGDDLPLSPGVAGASGGAESGTREVSSEEVVVFPRYKARLDKGRYVIDGLVMPGDGEGGGDGAAGTGGSGDEPAGNK